MAEAKETYVYIQLNAEFIPAGFLEMYGQGRESFAAFEYGTRYLAREDAISIDPASLPLQEGRFLTNTGVEMLFGGIRDASPDNWGRQILDSIKEGKTLTEFDYLTSSNIDRVGALAFGPDLSGPQRVFPFHVLKEDLYGDSLNLEQMILCADLIENETELSLEQKRFLARGSSLGGAQPKSSTLHKGQQWIVKFSKKYDSWSTCRVENATMTLARLCGINVPETKTMTIVDRDVFLIKRFDRDDKLRTPFISARALLGIQGESGDSGLTIDQDKSYQEIAEQFRLHGDINHLHEDLEELYKRMVFNVLCNNFDDHLRNHGFLYQGSGWRLSPVYDVVAQPEGVDQKQLYLKIGDKGRRATIKNALTQTEPFGLNDEDALYIVKNMVSKVKNNWQPVFEECGVPKNIFSELKNVSFAEAEDFSDR
ncbi:MAG: HipA domain-containing protein [Desulfobacteraceae bacterium]|nr:HipA domain-containing protein [Desulfobacteraceae bacterium]